MAMSFGARSHRISQCLELLAGDGQRQKIARSCTEPDVSGSGMHAQQRPNPQARPKRLEDTDPAVKAAALRCLQKLQATQVKAAGIP